MTQTGDSTLRTGDRVACARLGPGTVRSFRDGGRRVVVAFDRLRGLPVTLRSEELAPESSGTASGPLDDEGLAPAEALAAVESLKLGVVPGAAIDRLTVGCRGMVEGIETDLDRASRADPGGAFRLLVGPYGAGKSHLLDVIQARALDRGFLVARAVLDTRETTPDRPLSLYAALASSIAWPAGRHRGRVGLRPLLEEACNDPGVFRRWTGRDGTAARWAASPPAHMYLGPAVFLWRLAEAGGGDGDADRVTAWIEGRPQAMGDFRAALRRIAEAAGLPFAVLGRSGYTPPPMLQWRSATQLLSYLLGGIGVLATEVGYAGLAVLIDEAEFCQVVAARVRSDAERTARALLASALPEAAAGDLARGGTKRLADVPYRFRPAQHVAAFVTMTPEEGSGVPVAATTAPPAMPVTGHTGDASDPSAGMGMLHLTRIVASQGGAVTDVEPLSRGDLLDLCDRVISLARAARIPGATRPDLHERVRSHVDAAIAQGRRVTPRQVVRLAALLPDVPGPAAQLARSSR